MKSDIGVLYIATGEGYVSEALRSARSVKKNMPNIDIAIYTDKPEIVNSRYFSHIFHIDNPTHDMFDKVRNLKKSPFKKTIFFDSDIEVLFACYELFALLDKFELAIAHAPFRSIYDCVGCPISFPELNTGVILYTNTDRVHRLFTEWEKLYLKQQSWHVMPSHVQPTFREAIYKSDVNFYIIPPEYNLRTNYAWFAGGGRKVKILHGRGNQLREAKLSVNKSLKPRVGKVIPIKQQEFTEFEEITPLKDTIDKSFKEVAGTLSGYIEKLRMDPIFVVGFARSGTTLLQSLITTQEDVVSFPEAQFFGRISIFNKKSPLLLTPDDVAAKLKNKRYTFSSDAVSLIIHLYKHNKLSEKLMFIIMIADILQNQIKQEDVGKFRWLEKTPGQERYLEKLKLWFPNAKFVYIIRHPEKNILSKRKYEKHWKKKSWKFRPIEAYAKDWLNSVSYAEAFSNKHPDSIYIVRLEDLVRNLEKEMESICEFLRLSFDSSRLKSQQRVAQTLILNGEFWKNNVKDSEPSVEIAENAVDTITNFERLRMLYLLEDKMREYGYDTNEEKLEKSDTFDSVEAINTIEYYLEMLERSKFKYNQLHAAVINVKKTSGKRNPLKKYKNYQKLLSTINRLKGNSIG